MDLSPIIPPPSSHSPRPASLAGTARAKIGRWQRQQTPFVAISVGEEVRLDPDVQRVAVEVPVLGAAGAPGHGGEVLGERQARRRGREEARAEEQRRASRPP